MNLSELFVGSIGRIYTSSSIMIILALILIMSIRLYVNREKKAYLSLTLSLLMVFIQYVFIIVIDIWFVEPTIETNYIIRVLQVLSFILINMGLFQLYNQSNKREYFYFYLFIFTTLAITFMFYYSIRNLESPINDQILLHSIWIELYLFLLIFLCLYLVGPFIGQTIKYQLGLTIYFIAHLAVVVNRFVFTNEQPFLLMLEYFLPIIFFSIIFLFIFDRVVELLQAVHRTSITDGLTGLYNRRYFLNQVNAYVKKKSTISIIFCDIDNFKKLNDTKGHQKGDEVLIEVAQIMKEQCEDVGIAARYGGEELVILLINQKIRPGDFTEDIRKRIESETIVTISVGYSVYQEGVTGEELIEQSDQAMYQSKKSGKNKVSRFS